MAMPSTERKKSKFSNSFFTHTKHHPVYLTRIESQVCCLHSRTNVQHILSTCYFFFHFIYLFLQIPMYAQCVHQVDKHINVYIICAKLSHFCNKNPVIYKNKYIFFRFLYREFIFLSIEWSARGRTSEHTRFK